MKYLIVSELSQNGCEMYLADKADTEIAQNFGDAKKIFGKKLSEAFIQRTKNVFDENGRVEQIQDCLDCFDEDEEENEIAALFEIDKAICFAKDGQLNEYAYQNKCECDCDTGCTLVKYTPSSVVFDLDYENGFPYFNFNVHNMDKEDKIYYFEYKNWDDDISFRVVMYPIGE